MACHWGDEKVVLGTRNPVVFDYLIILKCVYADAFITCERLQGGVLICPALSMKAETDTESHIRISIITSFPIM